MGFFDNAKEFFTSGNWGKEEEQPKAKTGMGKAANKAAAKTMAANDIDVQRAKQDLNMAESQLAQAKSRLAEAEAASRDKQNARYDQELAQARNAYLAAEQRAKNNHLHIDYGAPKGSKKDNAQNAKAAQLESARDQAKAKYDALQDKGSWWAQNPPDAHVNPIIKEDVAAAEAAVQKCSQRHAEAMSKVYAQAGAQ